MKVAVDKKELIKAFEIGLLVDRFDLNDNDICSFLEHYMLKKGIYSLEINGKMMSVKVKHTDAYWDFKQKRYDRRIKTNEKKDHVFVDEFAFEEDCKND